MAIAPAENPLEPKVKGMKRDAEVMEAIKRKGKPKAQASVEKVKENLKQVILQNKINPEAIIRAGQLASAALKDSSMYQIAIQAALREGLISPQDAQGNGINYKLLASGITAGKLTQELLDEGAL